MIIKNPHNSHALFWEACSSFAVSITTFKYCCNVTDSTDCIVSFSLRQCFKSNSFSCRYHISFVLRFPSCWNVLLEVVSQRLLPHSCVIAHHGGYGSSFRRLHQVWWTAWDMEDSWHSYYWTKLFTTKQSLCFSWLKISFPSSCIRHVSQSDSF